MALDFLISGRVVDRKSGTGVSGIMVRAYDKDLLFDDLLGTAITDTDGAFELRYSESDFRELFERQPDVYLSLYEAGLIQSLSQGLLPELSAWVEVGGIAPFPCLKAPLPQPISI